MEDLINEGCEGALLVFCDERSNPMNPIDQLSRVKELNISFLIGPEGGFSDKERYDILELQNVIRLSLGSRILRADTAAIAVASFLQAIKGELGSG